MLAFLHYSNTDNVGDKYSAPYHYFDFGKYNVIDIKRIHSIIPYKAAIWGGGAIAGNILHHKLLNRLNCNTHIGWGFGRTVRKKSVESYKKAFLYPATFYFMGIRDYVAPLPEKAQFLPCVSCMHKAFDVDYPLKRKYSGFFNASKPVPRLARQDMRRSAVKLNDIGIEEAIEHLGSCQTVITNSYHGAYWGLLLGKGVIVLHPYSSKFYQLKWKVHYSFAQELKQVRQIHGAANLDVLRECRKLNRQFYDKVLKVLND